LFSSHDINGSHNYGGSKSQIAVSTGAGFEYKAYANLWLRMEGRYISAKSYKINYHSYTYGSDSTFTLSSKRVLLMASLIYRF
jgi:opacity protein-like surface antigen